MASRTGSHSRTPAFDNVTSSGGAFLDGDVHMAGVCENGTNGTNGKPLHQRTRSPHVTHDTDPVLGSDTGDSNALDDMQTLGQHSRQLIQFVQNLVNLNIDNTLPSLPKFVVVGDQSAGKSSIIEAACDVTLPRAAGTCTRCPFKITTKDGSHWSCKVSIHYDYSYDPHTRADHENIFDFWFRTEPHTKHLTTVHAKEDLAESLTRAQTVVLNPDQDPKLVFNQDPASHTNKTQFSPNVVTLEVQGPNLPEMSFYDLPGSINVFQDAESDHLVQFVETLIKMHIEQDKTLILLACAADQDVETSTSFRYIRECRATGRCMGVLTKPDLLNPSRANLVADVLSGQKFGLGHGWKVVKSLSQQELEDEVTHADARKHEQTFFSKGPQWGPGSALASFSHAFGIPSLQASMSKTLTEYIIKDLPEIGERVTRQYVDVCKELAHFPEKPHNTRFTVEGELRKLENAIVFHLAGDGLTNSFRVEYQKVLKAFKQSLLDARPEAKLKSPGFGDFVELSDDEGSEPGGAIPTPSKRKTPPVRTPRNGATPIRNPVASRINGGPVHLKQEFTETPLPPATPLSNKLVITVQDIQKWYAQGSVSGIPDQLSPRVTEHIVSLTMQSWPALVKKVKHDVTALFKRMLKSIVYKTLHVRKQLSAKTTEVALAYFSTVMQEQDTIIDRLLDCERLKPATLQDMRPHKESIRAKLLEDRTDQRIVEQAQKTGDKLLTEPERRKKTASNPGWHKLPADPYASQVEALVTPLAYYDLAAARLVDAIVVHLELGLVETLKKNLAFEIRTQLSAHDDEACDMLLAEDPQRELQRANLVLEKDKLEVALKELEALPELVMKESTV